MNDKLKVAVCQMTSVDDSTVNLFQMKNLIQEVMSKGDVDFFSFPENCLYMRLKEGEKIAGFSMSSKEFDDLSEIALKNKIALHLGSVALRLDGKLYNSSVFINENGERSASYQKIHLFDIQLEGEKSNRESDIFSHGEGPAVLEFKGWKLGQTICYDVRFAELYHYYAKQHIDVLLVPSSFLVTTGKDHWEILLRARAIESQCYVLAAAQAGRHVSPHGAGSRETYGRSLIISPWGKILIEASSLGPEVLIYDLSRHEINRIRSQIPMKNHRRMT